MRAFRHGRRVVGLPPDDADVASPGAPFAQPSSDQQAAVSDTIAVRAGTLSNDSGLRDLATRRAVDLVGYQNERYAVRYLDALSRAAPRLDAEEVSLIAANLHKLMAYKDEYEVARLHLATEASEHLEAVGGPRARVTILLHPPILRAVGLRRKLRFGPWTRPVLRALRASRALRGSVFDPFGYAKLRRIERQLVSDYLELVDEVIDRRSELSSTAAHQLLSLPQVIRGYEDIKLASIERYRTELAALRLSSGLGSTTV